MLGMNNFGARERVSKRAGLNLLSSTLAQAGLILDWFLRPILSTVAAVPNFRPLNASLPDPFRAFSSSSVPWQPMGPVAALLLILVHHIQRIANHGFTRRLVQLVQRILLGMGVILLAVSMGLVFGYFYVTA